MMPPRTVTRFRRSATCPGASVDAHAGGLDGTAPDVVGHGVVAKDRCARRSRRRLGAARNRERQAERCRLRARASRWWVSAASSVVLPFSESIGQPDAPSRITTTYFIRPTPRHQRRARSDSVARCHLTQWRQRTKRRRHNGASSMCVSRSCHDRLRYHARMKNTTYTTTRAGSTPSLARSPR